MRPSEPLAGLGSSPRIAGLTNVGREGRPSGGVSQSMNPASRPQPRLVDDFVVLESSCAEIISFYRDSRNPRGIPSVMGEGIRTGLASAGVEL